MTDSAGIVDSHLKYAFLRLKGASYPITLNVSLNNTSKLTVQISAPVKMLRI